MSDRELEAELRGKTFRVYMYMLMRGKPSYGVREIQRALGLSSPSVAAYHLTKLERMGLVGKKLGEYYVAREVDVGVLRQFMRLGRLRLPRCSFYATLVTSMLITYVLIVPQTLSVHNVAALIMGGLSSAFLWFEALKAWRELLA